MPVIVALAYLFWKQEDINWWHGLWALLNIIFFHAAGNTWSDYFDFIKGVDASDTFGAKALTSGTFQPNEIRKLATILLTVSLLGGLGLFFLTGWPLLWIGLGGVICTLLYPFMKYRALGDAVIAIAYAWLPMWGTSYAVTGSINRSVWMPAVPIGMITIAILHANNTRDIRTDTRAQITTLAMKLGLRRASWLYQFWIWCPFLFISVCLCTGVFPLWTLLILLALPLAMSQSRQVRLCSETDTTTIANLDEMTAKYQLVFCLLLAFSFILSYGLA